MCVLLIPEESHSVIHYVLFIFYKELQSTSVILAVRTALVALIAFMPTSPNGALGSLDYPIEERRKFATKSREAAPTFGSSERQKLIDEVCGVLLF